MGLSKKGIIIDADTFHIFVDKNHVDSKPIHKRIRDQKLQLVYGNDKKSIDEIKKDNRMFNILRELKKVVYQVDSKRKKKEIDDNKGSINGVKLKSDDPHIIAVALVEKKVRLLFSVGDKDLHEDFTNHKIIKPKGSVYKKYHKHKHLLDK